MWDLIRISEGVLLVPFIGLFAAYYSLRRIPFFIKCRWCHRWLILDPRTFRFGMCEKCFSERFKSDPVKLQQFSEIYQEGVQPSTSPVFYPIFTRIVKGIGCGKVLEVGCHEGYLLSKLNLEPGLLYGLDITFDGIVKCKNLIKGGNFSVADAQNIPYESNTFDYLICTEVLEHIEGDNAVRECYRVLKPGQPAFITVPSGRGVVGQGRFLAHVRVFTLNDITTLLKEAGFEIISVQKYGLYIPFVSAFADLISQALGKNMFSLLTFHSPKTPEFLTVNFFIECRKANKGRG